VYQIVSNYEQEEDDYAAILCAEKGRHPEGEDEQKVKNEYNKQEITIK